MSSARLSIRVDVDVEHARQVLEGGLASAGAIAGAPPTRAALADAVRALRERLRRDVMAAYPDARVVVTMWRKEPKARATKVRLGHRTVDPHLERRCALIGEHVDGLRVAAIDAMRREVAAAPLSALAGGDGRGVIGDASPPVPAASALLPVGDGEPVGVAPPPA